MPFGQTLLTPEGYTPDYDVAQRVSVASGCTRLNVYRFKLFSLSYQSAFQLSFTVLVC